MAPGELPFGEVNRVREFDYLAKKVGPCSKALDDPRNLPASRSGTPEIVSGSGFAGSFGVLDDADFGLIIRHQTAIVNHY